MSVFLIVPLLPLLACAPKGTDDSGPPVDTSDTAVTGDLRPGAYVEDRWELVVAADGSAMFGTDCGEGLIPTLDVVDGAFDVAFEWRYGGGAYEPTPVPATLVGEVDADTITALFTVEGAAGIPFVLVLGEALQLQNCA